MNIIPWHEGLFPGEGIYSGMPNNVYHAIGWPLYAHSSTLKELLFTEKHFISKLSEKTEITPALVIGSAIHEAVLEGVDLSSILGVHRLSWATTEGKKEKAELLERFGEDKILKVDEFIQAEATVKAIRSNSEAARHLANCPHRELSGFAEIEGVQFAVRLDAMGEGYFLDLKTTRRGGAAPHAWRKTVGEYFYHVQAALYRRVMNQLGADLKTMAFIVAEKEAPFEVAIYELGEKSFEKGDAFIDSILPQLRDLQQGGEARGYPRKTLKVDVEEWF